MYRIILALLVSAGLSAQTRVHTNNANGWFMYFGDHPISGSKWGVHLEGQWRRHDIVQNWQQLLLRPAVNYQMNANVMLTAGYGFIDTHRYGAFPVSRAFLEHRVFQQVQVANKIGKVNMTHRYRLEQRFLGQNNEWRHENRFRYMARVMVPLKGKWSLAIFAEPMINFGRNVGANVFDQNRAYVAAAYQMRKHARLEVGFMEQTILQRNGRNVENNHTFQLAVYSNLPFGQKK